MRCFLAFICIAATGPASAASVSADWNRTVPGAFRVVALRSELARPTGLSGPRLAALSPQSPLWTLAASRLLDKAEFSRDPAVMVRIALSAVAAENPVLIRELLSGQPSAMPVDDARNFSNSDTDALIRQRLASEHSLALAQRLGAVVAARGVDPGRIISQFNTQRGKNRFRTLSDYRDMIQRPGWVTHTGPTVDALPPLLSGPFPLEAMIDSVRPSSGRAVWAEIGPGYGIPQRQWSQHNRRSDVALVSVDLFDWENLWQRGLRIAANKYGTALFASRHRPELILSDAVTVNFPDARRPLVATAFESIQYWRDKIAGFVNLYNQAQDGGLLLFANDKTWTNLIQSRRPNDSASFFDGVIAALTRAGIEVATAGSYVNGRRELDRILVRKSPGSSLAQNARLLSASPESNGYTMSTYRLAPRHETPVDVLFDGVSRPSRR